jgi:hypothetical protein
MSDDNAAKASLLVARNAALPLIGRQKNGKDN